MHAACMCVCDQVSVASVCGSLASPPPSTGLSVSFSPAFPIHRRLLLNVSSDLSLELFSTSLFLESLFFPTSACPTGLHPSYLSGLTRLNAFSPALYAGTANPNCSRMCRDDPECSYFVNRTSGWGGGQAICHSFCLFSLVIPTSLLLFLRAYLLASVHTHARAKTQPALPLLADTCELYKGILVSNQTLNASAVPLPAGVPSQVHPSISSQASSICADSALRGRLLFF